MLRGLISETAIYFWFLQSVRYISDGFCTFNVYLYCFMKVKPAFVNNNIELNQCSIWVFYD